MVEVIAGSIFENILFVDGVFGGEGCEVVELDEELEEEGAGAEARSVGVFRVGDFGGEGDGRGGGGGAGDGSGGGDVDGGGCGFTKLEDETLFGVLPSSCLCTLDGFRKELELVEVWIAFALLDLG